MCTTGSVMRLTRDGSDLVINGGSDWVNEEELDLHDCFRWSPDGSRIAFWQFDLHGVGQYAAQSVGDLDLPPIMGVTLYGAFFIVFFSAVVDLVYAYLDPRIRPT